MTIEEVIPFLYEQGKVPAILVLDGIEDVRNIGALIRSAVWFDIHAILIPTKGSAQINAFTYKASVGAIKDIIICRESSITKALQFLKDSGVKLVAATMESSSAIKMEELKEPIALILGSEGRGVSREVLELSDGSMSIQGSKKVESLNVSVAGAILMHELYKIRNN